MRFDSEQLRDVPGFGVAGNFAGHLEQAGEARDFVAVEAAGGAPKGIFPFYMPASGTFLAAFPLSNDRLAKPASDAPVNLQIEPEVGLLVRLERAGGAGVTAVEPLAIAAFNDCSIRRAGAAKISHKKNWGPRSKGVAATGFEVDDLAGDTEAFRLASFLRRAGTTSAYGVDSALPDYSYFGTRLLDWIRDRLNEQHGAEGTPLEDVGALLGGATTALVGIGATSYTPFGEETFLEVGDESIVVLYDSEQTTPEDVVHAVASGAEDRLPGASVLRQRVEAGPPAPLLPG